MPDSLYDRLRDGTLRSLQLDPAKLGQEIEQARSPQVNAMLAAAHPHARIHGPIRLDPAQIDQYQRERKPGPTDWRDQPIQLDMEHLGQPSHTLTLNPERTAARWENQPGAFRQGQPLDVPLPPERPRVSNLKLGWQEGLSNLMGTIYGFSDDRRGPRGVVKVGPGGYGLTPTEPTMAEAMKNVVTDQNELEKNLQAQSSGGDRIVQDFGGAIPNAVRYAIAEAVSGGVPYISPGAIAVKGAPALEGMLGPIVGSTIGGGGADMALSHSEGDTPAQTLQVGANSALWGGMLEGVVAPGIEEGMTPPLNRAHGWLNKKLPSAMSRFEPAWKWTGLHAHELTEPPVEALRGGVESGIQTGVGEPTGDAVPGLFNALPAQQSTPQYGAPARITDQQLGNVMPYGQSLATPDNPRPLPPATDDDPAETSDVPYCGRASHTPCYAGGGLMDAMRLANGGAVDDDNETRTPDTNFLSGTAKPGPWTTPLSPLDELGFQSWLKSNNIPFQDSPTADYDMRGFYQAMRQGNPLATTAVSNFDHKIHFPDIWKTPYYHSFSNQSKYATPNAPHWTGDDDSGYTLRDRLNNVVYDERIKKAQGGALRFAAGGIVDGPDNSPGPIHLNNRGMLTLDPNAIQREIIHGPDVHVDPNAYKRAVPYTPQPVGPPALRPNAPQLGVLGNLGLGAQQSLVDLAHTYVQDRLGTGQSIGDAILGTLGIDQQRLRDEQEANPADWRHPINWAAQTLGGLPGQIVRYAPAAIGATIAGPAGLGLGSAMVDALKAKGEGQDNADALRSGLTSGLFAVGTEGLIHAAPGVARAAYEALPTHEQLQAAADAANQRLRASGIYSGAQAGAAGFLDPAMIRDMAVSTAAQLGSGAYSAAEIAAAKGRQIQNLIRNPSPPPATEIGPVADEAVRDVKRRTLADLEERIPNQERVVSQNPRRLVNGQPFSSLDMNAPSEGFLPLIHLGAEGAESLNQRLWQDAIRESEMQGGSAALDAVRKTGMRPPTAQFLDNAMSLPQRARYWYELSSEGFTGNHFDLPVEHQGPFIDNVAATSGGAEPYANMKRAIGTYAENLQNTPIMVDLRDPASVRHALDPSTSQLGTLKYNNFANTMKYLAGLHDQPPLSVNDVQMAKVFGIKGEDIGKNPQLYEVMSRYINKVRDAQNALEPAGAQPWETWQIQAPSWVHQRILDNPAKASAYDDYAQVTPRIIREMQNAGIPTPNGKVSMDTFADPRVPNAMSGTRENLMSSPMGTVEFATEKTPEGLAASQLRKQLDQLRYDPSDRSTSWIQNAKDRYEQIQRNAMADFAQRHGDDPSLVSQLMSEIVGHKIDVSRLEWNGYGTFRPEGQENFDVNPNLRIPMGGSGSRGFINLTKPAREMFLSILGQDLNQEGMAASHFTTIPLDQAHPNKTFSVFLNRYDGRVDQPAIQEFSRQIGYPVNVSQVPNGTLVDVNIGGFDSRPTYQQIENAANATLVHDPNVHDLRILGRGYDSDYVDNSEYEGKINAQSQTNDARGSGRDGNPAINFDNIERIRQAIRQIAQKRDADFAEWRAGIETRIGKQKLKKGAPPPSSP